MKDSTKKLLITILNIVIMVVNGIIAYLSNDSSSIPLVATCLTGVNACFLG